MTPRLTGKTALITGSTSNIGRAAAVAFAAEGAHVVVSGRDDARGAAVLAAIRAAGGAADFVQADLDGTAGASRRLEPGIQTLTKEGWIPGSRSRAPRNDGS